MSKSAYPPGVGEHDQVVLFDGVCRVCNAWAQFLIRHDTHRKYKLASVQSPEGQAILAWCGLPTDTYDTLVLVQGNTFHLRSDAVLRVLAGLPFPWPLAAASRVIPGPLRDWGYDRIARNRYRLFGRYDTCTIPTADHLERFLDASRP